MTNVVRTLAVDRTRALMRAAWMLAVGVMALSGSAGWGRAIQWRTMWSADRMTLAAMAFFLAILTCIGLVFAAKGLRWLALAVWPRTTQVIVGPEAIQLELGPFGTKRLAWSEIRVEKPDQGEDAYVVEDDPTPPKMRHSAVAGDLAELIMQFTGSSSVSLCEALAPNLLEYSTRSDADRTN